jgi:TRAP-type C4-dicarboxylate transport system permease small subunit
MGKQIDLFEAGFNRFNQFLISLVAGSIGLYAILIPLNLFLVKFQLGNMWWLYEGVEYILYVGVFIGAPWVLHQGAHVRVDVLASALSSDAAARLERVLDAAGSALCLLLCFYGIRAVISEYQDGTVPDKSLRIANWYMMSFFAMSFFLLAIEFLLRLRRASEIVAKEHSAPTEAGF